VTSRTSIAERRREEALLRLRHVVPLLCDLVERELAYREAAGDVIPGALTVDEVVDAAVVAGYRDVLTDTSEQHLTTQLRRLALRQIECEVGRLRGDRNTGPGTGAAPETPAIEPVATLRHHILYFFEPDEDVTPEPHRPTADEDGETEDLRRCLEHAFKSMPPAWRRAIFSRHIDGLSGPALARAVGRPPEQIEGLIDHARAFLREQLIEARCGGTRTEPPADHRSTPVPTTPPRSGSSG
jgi:DNA-directed RNA polymerase specialized sigma24 family protein